MLAVLGGVCLLVILCAVSFYFTNGYINIGEDKSRIFYRVAGILVPIWIVGWIASTRVSALIAGLDGADWFVVAYAAVAIISTLTSSYKETAVWGQTGWNLGLLVQLLMVGLYLMTRQMTAHGSGAWVRFTFNAALVISGVVLVLGTINRYSIYPIHMMGEAEDFISTIGNINWFCGYWCVWCGLGCGAYLAAGTVKARVAYGIYVWICALAGISCGSSSAYLAWLAISFAALLWALESTDRLARLCVMEIIMLAALPTIRFIGWLRPDRMWYDSSWLYGVTYENAWLAPFVGGTVLFGLLREFFIRLGSRHGNLKCLRGILIGLTIGISASVVLVIMLNSMIEGGIWPVRGISIFTWGPRWGNSRGGIWIASAKIFATLVPVRMFFGVGPDCFCAYAYSYTELASMIYRYIGDQYLTCAHNELLTMMINEGLFGAAAYAGLVVSHLRLGIRADGAEGTPGIMEMASLQGAGGAPESTESEAGHEGGTFPGFYLAVAAYLAVGLVGFMQILSTPVFFAVLGALAGKSRGRF